VANFAPDRPELSEKIQKFVNRITPTMNEIARPNPAHFCALLHGDCWNNNFMFLYDDDGNLESMKILDYQLMRYGCVCLDLVSFCRINYGSKTCRANYPFHLKLNYTEINCLHITFFSLRRRKQFLIGLSTLVKILCRFFSFLCLIYSK
jgi:hypothetical protein